MKLIKSAIKYFIRKNSFIYFKEKFMPFGISIWEDMDRLRPHSEKNVFFDIGANVGQTYLNMRERFSGSKIYCFEPSKQPYEVLQKKTCSDRKVKIFHAAVGEQNGECLIQTGDDSVWNKIIDYDNIFPSKKVERVQKITIDYVIEQENIDHIYMLKTDTEGYDLFVLKGAQQALLNKKISFIFCEVTFRSDDRQRSHFLEIFQYLSHMSYDLVALYDLSIVGEPKSLEFCNALFIAR
jgi:FkbM family methyltransferase